jgi:hypothetical protein
MTSKITLISTLGEKYPINVDLDYNFENISDKDLLHMLLLGIESLTDLYKKKGMALLVRKDK